MMVNHRPKGKTDSAKYNEAIFILPMMVNHCTKGKKRFSNTKYQ